jgi:tRNA(His) 5'-end guanylyltransferase
MKKDSLGDRMKSNYEKRYEYFLTRRLPCIIRLDGKCFSTFTKGFEKPWDDRLILAMNETAKYLCSNIMGCELLYTQSDELSLLLIDYKKLNSEAWFDNSIQKMCSVSAGLASAFFTKFWIQNYGDVKNPIVFDSRAFVIPESEVCNYFIWRQQDWTRNSTQMLARSLYSQSQLQNKNTSQLHEMCFEKGHNWNDLSTERALYCKRRARMGS